MTSSRRVLLICNDAIGQNMAGPAIRYWEFARVLSHHFAVILAVPPFVEQGPPPEASFPAKIKVCRQEADLYALARETEVIVTVGTVLAVHPDLVKLNKPLVLDTYMPFLLERLELYTEPGSKPDSLLAYEQDRNVLNTQLRIADFMICASDKQRDYWLGLLSALGRLNPYTYQDDKTFRRLIDVVPFGLPQKQARHTKQVLKGVYKSIEPDDEVLIWNGGIWDWLDPFTLIRAIPLVRQRRSKVKLVFMGTRRPNANIAMRTVIEQAIALSRELDLYDKSIFFNEWVPYQERQNYLLEADLGVSLHLNHIESKFSFRTRFLDHLWTGLPLLATEGDVLGAELVKLDLGRTVKAGDVTAVAEAIIDMLRNNNDLRQRYQTRMADITTQYQWESVTQPLIDFCANPYFAPDKAYLKETPLIETGPTPYWQLPFKAWQIFRSGGFQGLWRALNQYIVWKQGRWERNY